MRIVNKPSSFGIEVGGWSVRGLFCAAPSFFGACIGEFNGPFEIGAMIVGVAAYVYVFAWFSAKREGMSTNRVEWIICLKIAVAIKVLLSMTLPLFRFMVNGGGGTFKEGVFFAFGLPDFFFGILALGAAQSIGGFAEGINLGQLDSFGWTALTTLLQGVLITALLLVIALTVRGIRLAWRYFGNNRNAVTA